MNRIQKAQESLKGHVDALIVENRTDLFYLTDIDMSAGTLIITQSDALLLVDGRYLEACKDHCPCRVALINDPALEDHLKALKIKSVAFDSITTQYKRFLALQKVASSLKVDLIPLDGPLQKIRAIKEPKEQALLRQAAELGCRGYHFVLTQLKEGITERDVARALEIFWLQEGGQKLAFDPIIAFGANASKPHYRAGDAVLKKGLPVLIDIGVTLKHYHSDMTRTVFFGTPNPKMQEIYNIVKEAQQAAINACKPGITAGELDSTARSLIAAKRYGENFSHSLGHGIGLDVHEYPTLRNHPSTKDVVLAASMAITLEPGIYLPGIGGVRIEDTVIITPSGCENLTPPPKDLVII